MTRAILTQWYGSADVAEAVERGLLGDVDRAVEAARRVEAIRRRARKDRRGAASDSKRSTPVSRGPDARAAGPVKVWRKPQLDGETMHQATTAAPRHHDGLVAQALRSMPDLQAAWGRR